MNGREHEPGEYQKRDGDVDPEQDDIAAFLSLVDLILHHMLSTCRPPHAAAG
jgi:hypothetical protein